MNDEHIEFELPGGIPTRNDYEKLLASELFETLQAYSDEFLAKFQFLEKQYSWVKDPFHQWSRQWEYPFVYQSVLPCMRKAGDNQLSILDAGAGITFFPYLLKNTLGIKSMHCCDYDPNLERLYQHINKQYNDHNHVHFRRSDLRNLPFEKESFDIVYCISVLEHTENYPDILNEFTRVLKPNGKLIITFDIGLDNVSDISVDAAERLLDIIHQRYQTTIHAPVNLMLSQDIVTSSNLSKVNNKLLPWRFPSLSFIKSIIKSRRIPSHFGKSLTFYCGTYTKKAE